MTLAVGEQNNEADGLEMAWEIAKGVERRDNGSADDAWDGASAVEWGLCCESACAFDRCSQALLELLPRATTISSTVDL